MWSGDWYWSMLLTAISKPKLRTLLWSHGFYYMYHLLRNWSHVSPVPSYLSVTLHPLPITASVRCYFHHHLLSYLAHWSVVFHIASPVSSPVPDMLCVWKWRMRSLILHVLSLPVQVSVLLGTKATILHLLYYIFYIIYLLYLYYCHTVLNESKKIDGNSLFSPSLRLMPGRKADRRALWRKSLFFSLLM